jgi:EAL domain-containing protein (putative c-di-GMP-specific phosphodiesterase class I)
MEKRYLRPDGGVVWGSIHVSRVFDPEGNVDILYTQIVDVTARRNQEDELRHQLSEVSWVSEIRQALAEDRFELFAQPIVDLVTGETVQHELLLRLHDSDGNLVYPDSFLPAAERYGDIRDIDRWVIARAADLAATGMDVEINISGTSIGDPGLIEDIDRELERTGADPARLVFEITETALIESLETASRLAESLRQRGCRFALDDFGTGFGGFHYLKTLPLDYLKIDREFVRDLVTSESDRHVVWAVINLARGFGMQTIAEGVEDQETLDLLRELGADHAQGYFLGRPAPMAG